MVVLYSSICMCCNLLNQRPLLGLEEFFFNAQERTTCQMVLLGAGGADRRLREA